MQIPFPVQNSSAVITISIGISIFPNDTENADELIKYADQAMYHAKLLGKNRYSLFANQRSSN
jgi:diguanylate cyclase (GGDEF)-like protein